ncbi:hypothetical protein GXW71_34320 [Roseomonas hellenica]|uniref:Uncharacterized protein n=1 Tax=Plastoroseomonas hellenica TaxID=2687306 RepID=A0ABS5FA80_9PROT|nr:hypothetical protein [Plastoroseomonas hellenica]MBR0669469.1 hypothetical protein [Plastoroseomonas hellenica]
MRSLFLMELGTEILYAAGNSLPPHYRSRDRVTAQVLVGRENIGQAMDAAG